MIMIVHRCTSKYLRPLFLILLVVSAGVVDSSSNNENAIVGKTDFGHPSSEKEYKNFEERCNRVGGKNATTKLNNIANDMMQCFTDNFNITEIQEEVDKAKPEGNLDVVFRKYCGKRDKIKECSHIFISAIKACLYDDEMDLPKTITAVLDETLNFICYKEGDRIALFIGSEGYECVKGKQQNINTCINNTFHDHYAENTIPQSFSAVFSEENCGKVDEVHNCITKELKKCKEPTPANIIDSLLLAMKKVTPCASNGDIRVATLLPVMFCNVFSIFLWRYFS